MLWKHLKKYSKNARIHIYFFICLCSLTFLSREKWSEVSLLPFSLIQHHGYILSESAAKTDGLKKKEEEKKESID